MVVFNRCHNLARKAEQTEIDETIFTTQEEQTLYDRLQAEAADMQVWLEKGKFEEYLTALAGLRPAVDALFEAVMIMDKDEAVRANRLGLLRCISSLFLDFADFTKLI